MFTLQSLDKPFAYFSCSGPDSESLLKSGHFQSVLSFDVDFISDRDPAVILCGNQTTSFSLFNNLRQTFMKIKQKFHLVKDIATKNFDLFRKDDVEILRMDILKILCVFVANLRKINSISSNSTVGFSNTSNGNNHLRNIVMQLASEIKHLLISVGRISSIPDINTISDFSSDTSKRAFYFYHFYHLCLDIWYNCLAMLYIAQFSVPIDFKETFCDFSEHPSALLQVASFLIYDLSSISIYRYMNLYVQNDSPFLCSCVKDLWIMMIKLCDNINLLNNKQMFWSIFLSNLQILKKTPQGGKDLFIDKFSVFDFATYSQSNKLTESCFWLTSHVTSLYKYNIFGRICDYEKNSGGSIVGKYLIHNLLSDSDVSEKHLRSCLSHCIELSKLWEANAEILFPLTDFYIRKIDKTFSVQEISFSCLFKDAKSWFAYIENLSNHFLTSGKETSFDFFLSILSLQLQLDNSNNVWRSLKGRIYSKFMPKKIREMSETGLQNTFSLFEIIVISGQSEIVDKLCEVASIIETLTNPRKQLISWKALFVLLHINHVKKYDSAKITELLSKFFNTACTDYSKINCDSVFKNNLMTLLLVYIDNMNELFKSDRFPLSTHQLITSGFSDLLKSCSFSDQNYILGVILNILLNIQRITELNKIDYVISSTEYIRTLQLIFDNIYPFIEFIATTETVPPVLSDIAVVLTKLNFLFSSAINISEFDYYKIFVFFAYKDNVNSNITSHYLSLMLDCPQIIEQIKLRSNDLDVLIFQSWLRCLINLQKKNNDLKELTKKVLHLPIICEFVQRFETCFEDNDPIEMAFVLFNSIGSDFTNRSMADKNKQARTVQPFFKNFASLVVNKLCKSKDAPTFSHVYKLIAILIETCSTVLHHRVSSDSIMLQILDRTVYPQLLFAKDKTLQNLASCAIKDHLPRFMKGLFKLDYWKDKSVEREIRDIFIYYIGILPILNNPLIKLFTDSFSQNPTGLSVSECLFILEALKSSLLSNNENPLSIFRFYQEIFQLSPPTYKKDITNIILKCAMEIFMSRKDSIAEHLKELIKKVLIYYKDKVMLVETKIILKPLIMWFIQEKLQWSIVRGFTILDLFTDHLPQVMLDLIEFLKKSIETLEKNRGLGEDKLLRNGFQNIITKLQLKLNTSEI